MRKMDAMKIEVTSRSDRIREDVRRYAAEKVEKLNHFFDRITSVRVVLSAEENERHGVELVVAAGGGATFVAEERGPEPFAAVDLAVHKMERQLARHKEKLQERHRRPRPD